MAKILLVDDETNPRALINHLHLTGHHVQEAISPDNAFEVDVTSCSPDVVVLHVQMPVLSGLQLLVALREVTGNPDLPAVFLCGRVEPDEAAVALAFDALCLTDPHLADDLDRAIATLVVAAPVAIPSRW